MPTVQSAIGFGKRAVGKATGAFNRLFPAPGKLTPPGAKGSPIGGGATVDSGLGPMSYGTQSTLATPILMRSGGYSSSKPLMAPSGGLTVESTMGGGAWGVTGREIKPTKVQEKWYSAMFGKGERLDRYAGTAIGMATGKVAKTAVAGTALGITGYAGYSTASHQRNQHAQTVGAMNAMHGALKHGGRNRPQDFQFNPMMTFTRPRVRGGHMGATGGLTLAMNNRRTTS